MCTINPLDLSNYALIMKFQPTDLHLKRVLANGVWRKLSLLDQARRVKYWKYYKSLPDGPYESRFREIYDNQKGLSNLKVFLDFASSVFPNANMCIGTRSTKHLREIIKITENPKYWDKDRIRVHMELWSRFAQENDYQPIT
jgi:hypothetical protein